MKRQLNIAIVILNDCISLKYISCVFLLFILKKINNTLITFCSITITNTCKSITIRTGTLIRTIRSILIHWTTFWMIPRMNRWNKKKTMISLTYLYYNKFHTNQYNKNNHMDQVNRLINLCNNYHHQNKHKHKFVRNNQVDKLHLNKIKNFYFIRILFDLLYWHSSP